MIYNGADDRFFTQYSEQEIGVVLQKYKIKNGYIFFMANTDPRKNTAGVLQAYSLLLKHYPSPPKLLIKGMLPEQLQQHLVRENLQHIAKNINLIGYVDYHHLPMIYQAASMLWFPSFTEGFGLPIVEAMAGGVPVITSNASCMPEIAGEAALLINPHEPQTIADASIQILTDAATRRWLSENGKKRAALFTWNNAVTQLVNVYNEVEQTI